MSLRAGKWYVSILTSREVHTPVPQGAAIGIDMGVARFAMLSDGSYIAPLASSRKHEHRLAKYQRRMARKVGVRRTGRRRKRVQRIHKRIADTRADFLHKASDAISKSHAMIVVEDLKVRHMSRSASGTIDAPGRNVRAKSGLNKAILDQGARFVGNSSTRLAGVVVSSSPSIRRIRAGRVRAAVMYRPAIAGRRRCSPAYRADTRQTPITSARSMF